MLSLNAVKITVFIYKVKIMPKAMRKPEDIEAVRQHILKTALDILSHEGFNGLSMRKLASRLGMTAANIYNYYDSKDELFLALQSSGFHILLDMFQDAYDRTDDPVARLEGMIDAYMDFGHTNGPLYDAMLNGNTPRYTDYVGTHAEEAAWQEIEAAKRVMRLADRVRYELENKIRPDDSDDYRIETMELWFMMHAAVTLYNSRNIQQIHDDALSVVNTIVARLKEQARQLAG